MRLRAWDLTIERGGRRVIAGLSFEARAGLGLIVTGPNGAGKTSLLRALAGFLPIEGGGFALDGGDNERTVGEQAHYLGHAEGVKGALTAGENLAFAAAMLGGDSSRAAQLAALAALGLSHVIDFPARLLSAGQRRRVALARLLVAKRPVWLLDEPATALDAAAQVALAAVDAGAPRRRRHPCGRRSRAAWIGWRARAEAWGDNGSGGVKIALTPEPSPKGGGERFSSSLGEKVAARARPYDGRPMTPALALFLREWRIARRIGGGASVGVVFFLILVAVMPFALGPDLNLLARLGSGNSLDRGPAGDAARARPAVPGRP